MTMVPRVCRSRAAAIVAVAVFIGVLHLANAQNDPSGNFPVSMPLPGLQSPTGAVYRTGTKILLSSLAGQIMTVDIKNGDVEELNRGGDGQTLGDLCIDSREEMTVYAAGRESGLLYAFSADGDLRRRFRVTPDEKDDYQNTHFLSSCIQTRYHLFVTDATGDSFYRFNLEDVGPLRGAPPQYEGEENTWQGERLKFGGDWPSNSEGGTLKGISVEWSSKWNETGWMLHSSTGRLFTFDINDVGIVDMEEVKIHGTRNTFPGATKIMFDSRNENIMYILEPGRNAVSAIELLPSDSQTAAYIHTITSTLLDTPIALSEFGLFLYAVNGKYGAADRDNVEFNIVQIPRHEQMIDEKKESPYGEFTYVDEDEARPPPEEVMDPETVAAFYMAYQPGGHGKPKAPSDEDEYDRVAYDGTRPDVVEPEPEEDEDEEESDDDDKDSGDGDDEFADEDYRGGNVFDTNPRDVVEEQGRSCFPHDATVELQSGAFVAMSELKVGDRVRVGRDDAAFSPVIMFTHRDAEVVSGFTEVAYAVEYPSQTCASGAPACDTARHGTLRLSPGHYMYANGALVAASSVRVGDSVQVVSTSAGTLEAATVTSVRQAVYARGLYNPQTAHGDIVVNGVLASTYTTAVHPAVAHAGLAAVRTASALFPRAWAAALSAVNAFDHGCPRVADVFAATMPLVD